MIEKSISILIATFNRAAILRETLEAMCQVDREGIDAEWIVVNNNCTDNTDAVVQSFQNRIPIRLLHEPLPGKNRALNRGLNAGKLREVVVFTDDDVSPRGDWLHEVLAACGRWPDKSVFGGKVLPQFQFGCEPDWINQPWIRGLAFAEHDLGEAEKLYPERVYPVGGNLWVRRRMFTPASRYDESIGPVGNARVMGSETSFLKKLSDEGHHMVYCPGSAVAHRIKKHDGDPEVVIRRAISYGRGVARIWGVNYHNLLTESPTYWWWRQSTKLVWAWAALGLAYARPKRYRAMKDIIGIYVRIGEIRESFETVRKSTRTKNRAASDRLRRTAASFWF